MESPGLRLMPDERQQVIDERDAAARNKESWVSTMLLCLLMCDEGNTMEQAAGICQAGARLQNGFVNSCRAPCMRSEQEGPMRGKLPNCLQYTITSFGKSYVAALSRQGCTRVFGPKRYWPMYSENALGFE